MENVDPLVTVDSWYLAQNELKNTQHHVIEAETRRYITEDTDPLYQDTVEEAANMIFQLKQGYYRLVVAIILFHLNKGRVGMDIPDVEEVAHVSSYDLL